MDKENKNMLIEALNTIEKEKDIPKEVLLEAIETALVAAVKNEFKKTDNVQVKIDPESGDIKVLSGYEVVEEVEDEAMQITPAEAAVRFPGKKLEIGDVAYTEVVPRDFGRIVASKAKQAIVQKIREEERKQLYDKYAGKEHEVVTGVVQRITEKTVTLNLGKMDALLIESEQIRGESFRLNERVKVYVLEVKDTPKGPKITVSRTHPDLVKRLFENEVSEVADGIVEIKSISREAGQRTKMAVYSYNPNVDPVGACVGVNSSRVNAVVDELRGEKIDIINWSPDPEILIKNALSPAKAVYVDVNEDEHFARVVVPDHQLCLAIGTGGQNARLAARLTGYKIDIKGESQVEG